MKKRTEELDEEIDVAKAYIMEMTGWTRLSLPLGFSTSPRWRYKGGPPTHADSLLYDTEYNYIMPVVDFIEAIRMPVFKQFVVRIENNQCAIFSKSWMDSMTVFAGVNGLTYLAPPYGTVYYHEDFRENKIFAIFSACAEFAKWYLDKQKREELTPRELVDLKKMATPTNTDSVLLARQLAAEPFKPKTKSI